MLESIRTAASEDAPVGTAITAAADAVGRTTNEPVRIPKARYVSPEFAASSRVRNVKSPRPVGRTASNAVSSVTTGRPVAR